MKTTNRSITIALILSLIAIIAFMFTVNHSSVSSDNEVPRSAENKPASRQSPDGQIVSASVTPDSVKASDEGAIQRKRITVLSEKTATLVEAVSTGRPLELVIPGSKRQLLLTSKNLFSKDAKIRTTGGGEVLSSKDVYLFSGIVGKSDVTIASDVSGMIEAVENSSTLVPLSGMRPMELLASFDAKHSSLSVIGGTYTMALRNDKRDRILLRNNSVTGAMEMRYEPEALHKKAFGECSSEGCSHDHKYNPEVDMAAAMAAMTPMNAEEQAKFNQWIPVEGASLQAGGRPGTDDYQAVTALPGIDPATGQRTRMVDPIPLGAKYEESLKAFTVWCQTAPELLAEPITPTNDQIAAMMTRILLTMEEVGTIYEKDMGFKLIVGEWMVRTTGDGGVNKSVITDSWRSGSENIGAHINFYGWGGGGGAAGRSINISAWPVGTAHELGHVMGSGHSDSNDLMGPAGGPATLFGGYIINSGGEHRYTTSQLLYRFLAHQKRIGSGVQQRGVYEKLRIDGEGTTDMGSFNGALRLRVPDEIAYANEDAVVTAVNTAVEFDPTVNDDRRTFGSPYYNDDLSIEEVSRIVPAAAGNVEIINDGKNLRFTPASNFNGVVHFNYTLRGSVGNSGRGWLHRAPVAITVGTPVDDPTNITLAPGQDRWITQSGSLTEVDYPTKSEMRLSGNSMLLRAHPDATGSENFDVSIGGSNTNITVTYTTPSSVAVDDLAHSDGDSVIRFSPLSNDVVTGAFKTENNVSIKVAQVLVDPTDKMDFFRRAYVLKTATLNTPAMGLLEIETSFRILRDGSTGVGNTGFLRFTPAAGASGFAEISYTAEDADGTTLNGTARILVGVADVIRPLRKYTTVRRDMGLVLETQKIPASGAGFSGTSTLAWSVVNKPSGANVIFENGTSETAIARFDQSGRYRLRLSATDTANTKTVERWVYVTDAMTKHGGDERSPWLNATASELQNWNQSNWNTSSLGLTANDDYFASITNIARLGTATRSDGNNTEAQMVVSDTRQEPGDHFYGNWNSFSSKGTAAWWELDLGAEKATQWVDVHLGLSMLTKVDYENYGLIVKLLDANRSEVQSQKLLVKSAAHERHRIPVSAAAETAIRYVRIEKPTEVSSLNVHRVRVMSAAENEVDLTLWGIASQSTTPNSDFGAAYALDKRTHDTSGSRTDTTTDNNWWQIDFDQEYDIDKVKMNVNARGFGDLGNISGATITAYNAADVQTWQTTLGTESFIDITGIAANTMVKRIRIELPPGTNNSQGDKALGINEFWAWGAKSLPLTTTWSHISGPATAAFGNAADLNTSVTLPSNGTYVVRLTMDDGWNRTARDFTVNFDGGSTGPSGLGLADLDLSTSGGSNAVDLYAAFDDAETADSSMSYQVVSISNTAIFDGNQIGVIGDPANFSLVTLAGASGSSTVTVRATDGNSNSTDLTFTVNTTNKPPVIPAVFEYVVNETLAANTVIGTLNFTDPDGDALTYTLLDDTINKRYPWLSLASNGTLTLTSDLPATDRQGLAGMLNLYVSDGVNDPQPLTVIVTIADENREPGIDDQTFVVQETAIPGAPINPAPSLNSNNDPNESYTWSILSGNESGDWSIDPTTGKLIPLVQMNASLTPSYQLVVQVLDNGTPAKTGAATMTINVGPSYGHVLEDFFTGISGTAVADMTGDANYPNSPTTQRSVALEGLRFADIGSGSFGRRVRGALTVPASGDYTFHMASDDASELWLSTNADPANLAKIIDHTGVTGDLNFNGPSSSAISLVAGQKYAFEILHKEGGGLDYVGVGWSGPGGIDKQLIPNASFQLADDSDEDGLQDWWELTYIGNLESEGSDDPDSDGLTNAQELSLFSHPLVSLNAVSWQAEADQGVAAQQSSIEALAGNSTRIVDLSSLSGDVTYEFFVNAEDLGQSSVDLLNGNGWVLKFEQWNNRGEVGITKPGTADWSFTAESGQSVATPYGSLAHVVAVVDTAQSETRLYVNGVYVGTLGQVPDFTASSITLGAGNLRDDTDLGIVAFAAYDSMLGAAEIVAHNAAWLGNQPPVAADAFFIVSENAVVGTPLGTLAALDSDSGQTLSYAITSGNTGSAFSIDANTGAITTAAALDFEATASYGLTVTVTDDGTPAMNDVATITVNVTNANEAPSASDASGSIAENGSAGATVATVTATDPDAGDALSYVITAGNGGGLFAIDSSGNVTTTGTLDYEAASQHVLTVTVTDNGSLTDTATVTVNVTNVNEAPVASDGSGTLAEDVSIGTTVTIVAVSDPDAGDSLSYAITGGNTGNAFAIDSNGNITTATALDFDATPSYNLTVTVTDAGSLSDTSTVMVALTEVNQDPEFTVDPMILTNALELTAYTGQTLAGSATDADAGDTLTYSKVVGPAWLNVAANGALSGTPSTGDLGVNAFTIEVSDGNGGTDNATLNITVVKTVITTSFANYWSSFDWGRAVDGDTNTFAWTNRSAQVDDHFTVEYGSLVGPGDFQILTGDPGNGGDALASGVMETSNDGTNWTNVAAFTGGNAQATLAAPVRFVRLRCTAAQGQWLKVAEFVPPTNAAPVVDDATFAAVENSASGTAVGAVTATDPNSGDTLSYEITAGNGGGEFSIDANTGAITTAVALDFETTASYALTVTVTDDGTPAMNDVATITVNVTNANEAPSASDTSGSVAENGSAGAAVATVTATDPDADDSLGYAITAGNGGGFFAIDSSGIVTTTGALNYEVASQYVLTVTVTDSGSLTDIATVTANVTNVNEAPVVTNTSGNLAEDASIGTTVTTVSASDVDAGDSLNFVITGGNIGGAFAIDSSGSITTVATLDFETTPNYVLNVTVTDTGSLTDTATVTVTDVVEVTEPTVATGAASDLTQAGADIAFSVTDDGGEAPLVTIYYGETDGGTTAGNWDSSSAQGALATGGYNTSLSGLTEGTTYYYTVHASNSEGEAWGSSGSFTTEADTSPKLVRTTVNGVSNSSWTNVDLGQSYNSAVIVATPIYPNTSIAPVVTRIRNVSGSSFEVKIDRADGLTDPISIDVSIIAVEEGVYIQAIDGVTMEAVKYTSTVTAHNSGWNAEARSYQNSYTSPVVVGQVMSANDADWSVFWSMGSSRTNPVNASNLNVGKHVGEDADITRADETIGYIVIESGSGTINGVAYEAALGGDSIRGFGNSSNPYTYTLSGGLSTASAAAASISGMDGGNGAWAVLSGSPSFSTTSIGLHALEDQMNDSELKHTTTQVGYIVFE